MKLLLLFLSLFTFIFSNDKEVENEMAIPSFTSNSEITDFNFFIKKIYKILGGNL